MRLTRKNRVDRQDIANLGCLTTATSIACPRRGDKASLPENGPSSHPSQVTFDLGCTKKYPADGARNQ